MAYITLSLLGQILTSTCLGTQTRVKTRLTSYCRKGTRAQIGAPTFACHHVMCQNVKIGHIDYLNYI